MSSFLTNIIQTVKQILTGCFIIAVVSSSIFLVYIYVLNQAGELSIAETKPPQHLDTSGITVVQPSETTRTKVEPPIFILPPQPLPSEAYTVYIAAYGTEAPATEEVSRWKDAGYDAAVTKSHNYFNVALGRYATAGEARHFAEEMAEAFENGYIIGKIK